MYIAIKSKMDANRGADKIIDISRYTEMEIEHGHDTANTIRSKQGVHIQVDQISEYGEKLRHESGAVREKALQL